MNIPMVIVSLIALAVNGKYYKDSHYTTMGIKVVMWSILNTWTITLAIAIFVL